MLSEQITWPGIMDLQNNAQSRQSLSYAEHTGVDYGSGVPVRLQRLQGYGVDSVTIPLPTGIARDITLVVLGTVLGYLIWGR